MSCRPGSHRRGTGSRPGCGRRRGRFPGPCRFELLLAHTDTHAVLVSGLRAYPTGLDFVLAARRRPGQPDQHHRDRVRDHLEFRSLRLELRFADGRTVSNDPRRWPRTFETEEPDPPMLYHHGGDGGSDRGWRSRHWLWGLPPPGPLAFVCEWPARQIPTSGVRIDARPVLEAADRAAPLWPTG